MFAQYACWTTEPNYWLCEHDARRALLGDVPDRGQILDYQSYRLAFRDVAAATNERCMTATILPRQVFCPHTVSLETVCDSGFSQADRCYLLAVLNSFVFDNAIRHRVTNHVSFFLVYAVPVPRLRPADPAFRPIVERAARLVCTAPEFDDLAREIFGKKASAASVGATDPTARARLRAELDGLIAHLYGLTEDEFLHILSTFPLVPDPVKIATHNAYRDGERGLIV